MNADSRDVIERVVNPFDSPIVAAPTGASASALVQRESSEVMAQMAIARRFPRDQKAAVDRILMSCTRPALAEDALYQYSRGGTDVTGPSIRLAEEIARQWGNMVCGVAELSRHGGQSEVQAYAMDYETGFRDEKRFNVRHWRDTRSGGHVITEERDIYEHIANMGARRKRACILAVIPGDVVETAVKQCDITLRTKADVTPERIKAMVETFAKFGVTKEQIEKRIQRHVDSITPALLVNLGRIANSMRDGMSSPADWFEGAATEATVKPATATDAVKEKLAARTDKKTAPAQTGGNQPAAGGNGESLGV